jgi:hypothetical protein
MNLRVSLLMLIAISLLASYQAFTLGGEEKSAANDLVKSHFKEVSSGERETIVKKLQVSSQNHPNINGAADVLEELNMNCKGFATYERDANGKITKPVIECNYIRDEEGDLDGMSPKFKCKFKKSDGESKKLKVKYANSAAQSSKEIATGILGPSMARFMGFKADTYCPAVVVCKGCAADPWSKEANGQSHSSLPAIENSTATFKYALIEMKLDGWKVSIKRNGTKKPLGFEWDELKNVDESLSLAGQDRVRIEREAYMLWINFIYHTDADAHNNRLVCEKLDQSKSTSVEPLCLDSAGYVHDYGDSFKRMNLNNFNNTPVFYNGVDWSHPLATWGTDGNICVGTMGGGEGAIGRARFSNEARLLFIEKFDRITNNQLIDLFNLAEVTAIDNSVTPELWAKAMTVRRDQVNKKNCESFSDGASVLHP